ncbi:MAG: 50S ribosomal protein L37ae [Nanoarchaeota archaeon]|nr:50S ribosomal protein L37ae [Nanoarchaeota archaeon]MBU1320974.1 50S ribosomal protein L37ae [Nanoarchaeota archaeon]MBU1598359.1 50S ribosomal protein L37ae [Nanoarchaeota archaeon]MBU2441739.1 50S ribosomal protein L37ae [Nanoarchaeota archaeon]
MVKRATYGSVRRLGSRYGRTVRFKLGKIEAEQRKKHKCPYCNYEKVRRQSAGIWHCSKCKSTFTNKAYTVGKVSPVKQVAEEESPVKAKESSSKAADSKNQKNFLKTKKQEAKL